MKITEDKIDSIFGGSWRKTKVQQNPKPKYQILYDQIKNAILNKELPEECELPATRVLSEKLNLSRSTVIKVYEILQLEGFLEAKVGSGHFVKHFEFQTQNKVTSKKGKFEYPALSDTANTFYDNRGLINTIDDKEIAFRPGLPPLDLFPITQWKKLSNQYWQFVKASELTFNSGSGVESLRKTIANYLNLSRNIKCSHHQIFIVGGSLQSLYLISNLLINPEDSVFIENPTFPNVHSVFKGHRAKVIGLNLDHEGVELSKIKTHKKINAKLIHVTPSCHYPLGIKMSLNRKKELLETASKKGLYIVENDYENEINNANIPQQTLFDLDTEQRTFYISTFNRILHPSIRLGFMVVPLHLTERMQAIIDHSHRFISPSIQITLRGFLEKKHFHNHIFNLQTETKNRHETFSSALHSQLRNQLTQLSFGVPSLHITTRFNSNESDEKAVKALLKNGIICHSLSKCYIEKPKLQGLIFGYSCVRPQNFREQFALISKTLHS